LPKAAAADNSDKTHPFRRARTLRYSQTLSEYRLWQQLRRKQIRGLRFRRQHPIGPYFADFICIALRLIIEVDGVTHLDAAQIDHDIARTQWLRREGYDVLRFWNLDVLTNMDHVIERIDREVQARLRAKTPPPAPLEGAERSEGGGA
jgi:very-short-patch-repair endonuclease